MKKPKCRWCSEELEDGRVYENFCHSDCAQEWEDTNCDGEDDDVTDMWLQYYYSETPHRLPHKKGARVYSLVGFGIIWFGVFRKVLTIHIKSDKGAK